MIEYILEWSCDCNIIWTPHLAIGLRAGGVIDLICRLWHCDAVQVTCEDDWRWEGRSSVPEFQRDCACSMWESGDGGGWMAVFYAERKDAI